MNDPKNLRAKFQITDPPLEAQKIGELVRGRQKSSMDDIAKIIHGDKKVTQRLITMAFPKISAQKDATLQMATSRLGINRVICLMVSDLLNKTIVDTFSTMFDLKMEMIDPTTTGPWESTRMVATVKFTGKTNGEITLAFSWPLSVLIAATIMGGNIDDKYPREVIIDAVGEIVNIVTGNVQSGLSDAGMESEIGLPDVLFTSFMPKSSITDGTREKFYYRHGFHHVDVEINFVPFAR